MKMNFFSFSVAILAALTSVNAQSGGQIRAGINLANVSVNENGRVDEANMLTSFHVGVVGDVPLGTTLSFQPGLLFTGKGSKIQQGDPSQAGYYKQTSNPYYLEVPLNLIFKGPITASSKFFAGAGPYLAMGVAGKNKTEGRTILGTYENERDIEFSNDDPSTLNEEEGAGFGILRRFDYGFNGTAGIEGKSLVLGVNYGLGLAKLQSGSNNSQDNNNKHRVLGFFLGFKF
ncbi:MAG: PorT family protein [Chitinophagaceae bacterium]|nr:PorT family protein [Chitinophagaceae bacterium]